MLSNTNQDETTHIRNISTIIDPSLTRPRDTSTSEELFYDEADYKPNDDAKVSRKLSFVVNLENVVEKVDSNPLRKIQPESDQKDDVLEKTIK